MKWVECIGPKGQKERLSPCVANIPVNLWGHDTLQQWISQINIPAVSEMENKQTYVSGKDIIRYYKNKSSII